MGSWTGLEPGRVVGALDISIYKNKDGDLPGGQWLRLLGLIAGGQGSIPGQGTRSHVLQQRSCVPQVRPGTNCTHPKDDFPGKVLTGISVLFVKHFLTQCSINITYYSFFNC